MINPGSFFDFLWKILILVSLTSTFVFGALVLSQSFLKAVSGRFFKTWTRASLAIFFAIIAVMSVLVVTLDKGLQVECFNHFTQTEGILGLTRILAAVWGVVGLLLLAKDIFHYRIFKGHLAKNIIAEKNGYKIVTDEFAPLTVGFVESQIVIPAALENKKESLRYILAHESVHVKNQDGLWSLLALLCLRLCWFNPAAWFFVKAHNLSVEMATDEEVVAQSGSSISEYSLALIEVLDMRNKKQLQPGTLAASAEFSQMQDRLRNLSAPIQGRKKTRWLIVAVLSAAWLIGIEQSVASLQLQRKTNIEELMCYQVQHEKVLESLFRAEVETNKCE